jgi:hypothetical protein
VLVTGAVVRQKRPGLPVPAGVLLGTGRAETLTMALGLERKTSHLVNLLFGEDQVFSSGRSIRVDVIKRLNRSS